MWKELEWPGCSPKVMSFKLLYNFQNMKLAK